MLSAPSSDVATLQARMSAAGNAGRRSSMGGIPLKMEEVDDKLNFAMRHLSLPSRLVSEIEMHDFDSDDELRERLTGWEEDNIEVIVSGSTNVQAIITEALNDAKDIMVDSDDVFLSDGKTAIVKSVREACYQALMRELSSTLNLTELVGTLLAQIVYPLQDAQAKHEASAARKVLLELIENAGNGGIEELKDAAAPKLDSQILFEDTVDTLRNLHDAYLSMNEKYEAEIANAERLEAELADLLDEELDIKLGQQKAAFERSQTLQTIRDSKMTKVYTAIENAYPDISGSASSAAWSKKSSAMHVYELPDDILTGEPDPKVYAKFLDDLIQICQNWLPGFWSIIPMLMRLKTHEDQFSPIEILTISEWQQEKHMGAGLGEVFQQQMSKLWSIVARGNTETLPTMQMTAIEGSLFQAAMVKTSAVLVWSLWTLFLLCNMFAIIMKRN